MHISELSLEALKELEQLEPFGPGNATPVFILRNVVSVRPPRTIGNQGRHLKITVRDPEFDGPTIDAIGWNMGEMAPQIKQNKQCNQQGKQLFERDIKSQIRV